MSFWSSRIVYLKSMSACNRYLAQLEYSHKGRARVVNLVHDENATSQETAVRQLLAKLQRLARLHRCAHGDALLTVLKSIH